jgi:hypothetical protein
MNYLWYKEFERSSFHWVNDSREWLQVDKTGHFLSTYIASRYLSAGFKASGMNPGNSILLGTSFAFIGVSTIEVFDGFSAAWGASASDLLFNTAGGVLFLTQNLLWKDEYILPKISWHPTEYAKYHKEVLGRTFTEQLMKDYNGHTLWIDLNLHHLFSMERLPEWFCLSLGYGAEGMISGFDNPLVQPHFDRYRQFYCSLDADLSKIKTSSRGFRRLLDSVNFIKIPFPALEIKGKKIEIHGIYF